MIMFIIDLYVARVTGIFNKLKLHLTINKLRMQVSDSSAK